MNYKIFTYEEFDALVKHWWEIMILKEFPEVKCVPIKHDVHKRRTSNLGKATYKRVDGGFIPWELSFSFRLLDGRYKLSFVEDIIKHEIGHQLDLLRNGKSSSHGKPFQQIAEEFGFNYSGKANITINDMSEIWEGVVREANKKLYKYFLVCDCGSEYKYENRTKIISSIIKRGNTKYQCRCHMCKSDDKFTLYIVKDGVGVDDSDYKEQYKLNSKIIK